MRYVDVTITRQTQAVAQQGFGTVLILGTSKVQAYKEYTSAAAVGTDYGGASKEAKIAAALFGGLPSVAKVATLGILYNGTTGDPANLASALNALVLANNDWYYLVCPEQGDDEIAALSAWAGANSKLYFVETTNEDLVNTGMNTIVMIHNEAATSYPAAAWVGVGAPLDVGSFTWTFKTLSGINPTTYDEAAVSAIHESSFNTYIRQSGVNITSNGKTAGGEWIDVIQSQHFLSARISEAVFSLMVRLVKSRSRMPVLHWSFPKWNRYCNRHSIRESLRKKAGSRSIPFPRRADPTFPQTIGPTVICRILSFPRSLPAPSRTLALMAYYPSNQKGVTLRNVM